MLRKLQPVLRVWPFFALLILVYLASLDSLRFVLDDWCQIPKLAGLLRGEAPGWLGIVDNGWLGGKPRIFFLTWLLQGVWARIWGLNASIPYFLLGFVAHLSSCLLLGRLLRRAGLGEKAATFTALACFVAPTSSNALFWINCWQFVLPVTGFMILAELYFCPFRNRWADLAALSVAAVCTQFLGEQILPVLYAGFGWALLTAWRQRDRRALFRVAIPAAAAALSLGIYYQRCVAPYLQRDGAVWNWSAAWDGIRALASVHAGAFTPFSGFYGKGGVAPSLSAWALIAAVALTVSWTRLRRGSLDERSGGVSFLSFIAAAAAVFVLCQLPTIAGIAKGLRSMEYRYTYLSGLALTAILTLALRGMAERWHAPGRVQVVATFEVIFVVYLAGLTIYDLRDIWGGQKRLDDRIWAQIESQYRPEKLFIMTDSLTIAPLMPARSNAISDFQDDFAISCRLRATGKLAPAANLYVTRRYHVKYERGGWMYLPAYRDIAFRATPDRILAVVFRYGPSFADMLDGKALVFPDFDAYKRYRTEEKFDFEPLEFSPGK
ncbi:MAG: hypothetical protein ABL955_02180 [Elusimicrobiota bacterium]